MPVSVISAVAATVAGNVVAGYISANFMISLFATAYIRGAVASVVGASIPSSCTRVRA